MQYMQVIYQSYGRNDGNFDFDKEEYNYSSALDRSVKFINDISEKFEKNDVKFLIENLFPSVAKIRLCFVIMIK